MADQRFTIVGAGLGGALLAVSLGKRGYPVDLYEMRGDLRELGAAGGRSINLALSHRGLCALEEVGLADEVMKRAVPMRGRMLHAVDGSLTFQPYGTEDWHCINSVSRSGLNVQLLDAAERLNSVSLKFRHKCLDVDLDAGTATFEDHVSQGRVESSGLLVGADGAFSAVRSRMQRTDLFDYSQQYLPVGYKELTIPPADGGGFRLENHALHIWPRGPFMMIALPNADGSFTCTLFWPLKGPGGFETVRTETELLDFFERHFPDALPHLPTLVEDYETNPTSSLVTVRCGPWYHGDRCVLLGDACHAVVPFYGQGMNAAFEDVLALSAAVDRHAPDWGKAFRAYYDERKEDCDTLCDLAIDNFNTMSRRTRSTMFLLQKKVEALLCRLLPNHYVPIYTMVTFTRMGYADAVRRDARQKKWAVGVGMACLLALVLLVAWVW